MAVTRWFRFESSSSTWWVDIVGKRFGVSGTWWRWTCGSVPSRFDSRRIPPSVPHRFPSCISPPPSLWRLRLSSAPLDSTRSALRPPGRVSTLRVRFDIALVLLTSETYPIFSAAVDNLNLFVVPIHLDDL
ncbi:hypothetical protein OG21DRAFT_1488965 [Imleria badia]|nr:hypothetical protein OG21DRAFT_1488965 [Imleria badia]